MEHGVQQMESVRWDGEMQEAIDRAVRMMKDEPDLKVKSEPDMHDNSQENKKRKYR